LAVQRNIAIGVRAISVLDVQASSVVVDVLPPSTVVGSVFEWTPDSSRVHFLSRGASGARGAIDVATAQTAFSVPIYSPPIFSFSGVTPKGLAVDSGDGSSYELYQLQDTFGPLNV